MSSICEARSLVITDYLILSGILTKGQTLNDYLYKTKMADAHETVFSVFSRSIAYLVEAGREFSSVSKPEDLQAEFLALVSDFRVILGSPILTNAGRRAGKSISACSIPNIRFAKMQREQISKIMSNYHTQGMGTGFSFDELADPVAMMKYLNEEAIKEVQHGLIERPSGNMGVVSISHPKVREFINVKRANPDIREWKFNISVNITDEFMRAWKSGLTFCLQDSCLVNPQELMRELAANAHATGDPGVVFLDRMNTLNRVPQIGSYKAVVPCGEVSLFEGEVCQFAYLNLPRFIVNQQVDKESLKHAVHAMVKLLDNAVEANINTLPESSASIISDVRRIGVGVCGFAEMLHSLGVAYDSDEGVDVALNVMSFINFESKKASIELAKTRGPFPRFLTEGTRRDLFLEPFKNLPTSFVTKSDWESLDEDFAKYGIRNLSTTIIPPSGRSSLLGGSTGSIEPPFRLVADATFRVALERECKKDGYLQSLDKTYQDIAQTGSIQDSDLPSRIKSIFKCALEIAPEAHMRITAAYQRHVDEGVSKTINLPNNASIEDVLHIFRSCYDCGLKGITVYRDGSRTLQPKSLTTNKDASMLQMSTMYGPIQLSAKIAALLDSSLVSRLKQVRQNGCAYLVDPRLSANRFDHSLGLVALAQLLKADESVQIAALLHDISHTAFSHLGDIVFANKKQDFHEVMYKKFMQSDVALKTIETFGLSPKELDYHAIPLIKGKSLTIDRLDYCIRDLLAQNRICQAEYASIVHNLVVDETGEIRCKDLDTARLIFTKFIEANTAIYFDPRIEAASIAMATLLQSMLKEQVITADEFFTTDGYILEKLGHSRFKSYFEQIGPNMPFTVENEATKFPALIRKLRFVDPKIVGLDGGLTSHCPQSKASLDAYLTTPTTVYYTIPMLEDLL